MGIRGYRWFFEGWSTGISIEAGGSTPVQLVESETTFSEVPLKGKLIFVSVDPEGNVSAYRFDSERSGDYSFMMEVSKGWLMFWHAQTDQELHSEVLEYEEPGFSASKLTNIEFRQKTIGDREIPEDFWRLVEQLNDHQYKDTVIPIVDLSELR